MIALLRHGVRHDLDEQEFGVWADAGILPSDHVLDVEGCWRPANTFPELEPYCPRAEPPTQSGPSIGEVLLTIAAVTAVAVVAYKVGQALFDEDFGGRAYPTSFRADKIRTHLDAHGSRCLRCVRRVRVRDLTVDHIVPWARGGLTSRFNADVMCGACNSSKGSTANLLHYIRGRAA
jgi:hypothetical protein